MAKRQARRASKAARKSARRVTRAGKAKRASSTRAKGSRRPASRKRVATKRASAPRRVAKKAARKTAKRAVARKATPPKKTLARTARKVSRAPQRRPPTLDRERRTVSEETLLTPPSSLNLDRSASAARSGRAELAQKVRKHTSTGPGMTAGDLDADWEAAESIGDEAPGGDNPTPDQDVVDEIGKALGVEYDDDEELRGGDEITDRDRNRWELDPASSDDFDDRDE